MTSIVRYVVAVIVGGLVAFLLFAAIQISGHLVYQPPPGLDPNNPEQLRLHLQNLPQES